MEKKFDTTFLVILALSFFRIVDYFLGKRMGVFETLIFDTVLLILIGYYLIKNKFKIDLFILIGLVLITIMVVVYNYYLFSWLSNFPL